MGLFTATWSTGISKPGLYDPRNVYWKPLELRGVHIPKCTNPSISYASVGAPTCPFSLILPTLLNLTPNKTTGTHGETGPWVDSLLFFDHSQIGSPYLCVLSLVVALDCGTLGVSRPQSWYL